jgi:lipopolysaccharide/colanic/teichoic acid biosynthesis glycosyltransferase
MTSVVKVARKIMFRLFDIVASLVLLVLFSPILLFLCTTIYVLYHCNPIYSHIRIGKGFRPFKCFKLRSMWPDADRRLISLLESDLSIRDEYLSTYKLRNDPRVTPLGKYLRILSLDELPQLVNVLLGDMSLVGPRPIVSRELYYYGRYAPKVLSIKPGISGLWQISGRNNIHYPKRITYDLLLLKHLGIRYYIYIFFRTIRILFDPRNNGAS